MKRQSIVSIVLASAMTMIVAVPCAVRADGGHYGYGPYAGRPPYHAPYYPRYYPHYYRGYYPNYAPHYYPPGNSCNNCGNNHNHNNHDHNNELWYGLLGGGVLGYTLGNVYPIPQH